MSMKIDKIPLPEIPLQKEIRIPKEYLAEFDDEIRIIIKFPYIVGIPVPEYLLEKMGRLGQLKDFEVMLVQKEMPQSEQLRK